jgi:predicted DNA-binding transcriptional regulator YafY
VTTPVEHLIRAASAIRTGKRIRFDYQAHDGNATRRHIEPYAVVHTDGRWYLIGYCLSRRALRTFRLDRVANLESGAGSFRRPADFDARQHLRASMPFVQSQYQIDVWIDLAVEEARKSFGPLRVALEEERGGTRVRCGRDRLEMIAAMLLSIGRRIVVDSPPELRKTFRELARQALKAAEKPRGARATKLPA